MKSDATALRRKILLRLMLAPAIALAACCVLWAIAAVLPMASIIQLFLRLLGMSRDTAYNVYRYLFANNINLWAVVSFIILFIIAMYIVVRAISRSFVHMAEGVDRLLDEGDEPIRLPAEFDFLEARLNEARRELQHRQQVAQQAEMRKNDLVVYLAHDIKTPLTSVIGYLSLLDEAPDMPAPQRTRYIGVTLEKAYRLEQLIDEDTLRASPIEYGLVTFELAGKKGRELYKDRIPEGRLMDYIMASAAYPGLKRPEIDGKSFLDGGLSIEYYRAATPFLAREIFRELFTRDQNAKNYEPLPFSLPDVEEVSAYSSIFPTVLLRKDEEVLCVSFYQASENAPIPIEEWARVFADSLQG